MKPTAFTVISQRSLTPTIRKLVLRGDTRDIERPGQFVNLKIDGCYLRRPLSVCDKEKDFLTLIYRIVGTGTERLSRYLPGERLDLLTGLGNGYDLSPAGDRPLLLGGGVGIPPLYFLAKELIRAGAQVSCVLGFADRGDLFYETEFRDLGCSVTVTTVDGSYGIPGFVTDAIPANPTYFYACGPEPMLRAVCRAVPCSGQLSFEERMGCGFGACMGCSCRTLTGNKRICREGPVLRKEEILWND